MSLRNNYAPDIEGLTIKPVKFVADFLALPLCHIINLSLESCVFPTRTKLTKVTVIFKSGSKNVMSNYRSISILPLFSKVIEKIIHKRLQSFFDTNKFTTESQFGFRKGFSTESALLHQKEIIIQNIENKHLTLGIFVDFSKAFDCLHHDNLLDKLNKYGVRGKTLQIFSSYLKDREQIVNIDGFCSSKRYLKYGTPQGSILGLFFSMFT